MPNSFSKQIIFDKKQHLAVIIPELRKDGMYYEVNIKGFPRFYMAWSQIGRYDAPDATELKLPYDLVLAVSDILPQTDPKRKGKR